MRKKEDRERLDIIYNTTNVGEGVIPSCAKIRLG